MTECSFLARYTKGILTIVGFIASAVFIYKLSDHKYIRNKQTFIEYRSHDKGINKMQSKHSAFNLYYLGVFFTFFGELLYFFHTF